ncbi:MAG TPA: hypothetical protein VFX49_04915 [Chloroflexota bacterium]|nr:hypothetical protein [Chloroflexota bacterium]
MSDTIIIRESPGRAPGRAGFVVPAPSTLLGRTLDKLVDSLRAHGLLVGWWTISGAALWPATLLCLSRITPTYASVNAGAGPSDAQFSLWLVQAALFGGAVSGVAQWLLLRRLARGTLLWVPATAGAWALGMLAANRGVSAVWLWLFQHYEATPQPVET